MALPAPQNLLATPGQNSVGLSWDAVAGSTGYDIYRSTVPGQLGTLISGPGAAGVPTSFGPWTLRLYDPFATPAAEGAMINAAGNGLGAYANTWGAYSTGTNDTQGNSGTNSGYDNSILSVGPSSDPTKGNVMKFRCHVSPAGRDIGAAPYPKLPGKTNCRQTYGRIQTVLRCPNPVQGWKTAWLRWATAYDARTASWPRDGETDFPEGNLNGTMSVNMHWMGATAGNQQDHYGTSTTYTQWHTLVDEWTPGDWKFYIDGILIGHSTGAHVPNVEMRWLMQTETVLSNSGRPIAGQECTVEVDSVACWDYTP